MVNYRNLGQVFGKFGKIQKMLLAYIQGMHSVKRSATGVYVVETTGTRLTPTPMYCGYTILLTSC